jgi:hypothetical protein
MTPQEKAKELYSKFLRYVPAEEEFEHEYAKQCALVTVDEIIPIVNSYENALSASQQSNYLEYWYEVKEEIEKL